MTVGKRILVCLSATALLATLRPGAAHAQEVDVAIATTAGPASPVAGSPITYTHRITVAAGSATSATNVIVTDVLPEGTTYGSGSPACALACERRVVCSLGAVTGVTTVVIVVTPASAGPIQNVASVETDEYELDVSNNVSATDLVVAPATHSVSGTVRLNGTGLPGVLMTPDVGTPEYTGPNGAYTISDLANGSNGVTPSHPAYTFSPVRADFTIAGADLTGIDFTATPRTYRILGTVTLGGVGLEGVTVSANGTWAVTNAFGAYAIEGLVNGSYTVAAALNGYVFSPEMSMQTVAGADVSGVDFTAAVQTFRISGTVTLQGAGVQGVVVTAGSISATTDTSGAYSIAGLANGTYVVTPFLKGDYQFSPASVTRTISGANEFGVDFAVIPPTFSISGRISLRSGDGVAGVTVRAARTNSPGQGSPATGTTDRDGVYSISGLAAGSYTVTPVSAAYTFSPIDRAVNVGVGPSPSVDFEATPR